MSEELKNIEENMTGLEKRKRQGEFNVKSIISLKNQGYLNFVVPAWHGLHKLQYLIFYIAYFHASTSVFTTSTIEEFVSFLFPIRGSF